jgi:hypothetical protein
MKQAAQCILNSTEFDAVVAGKLPIAKTLTNGLIELAWESLCVVPDGAEQLYTGLVLKRMLARLVAAAWRGAAAPAQLDEATAERVGKRLQKQVDTKLKGLLGAASSKAKRARSALSRASAEEGLDLLAARMAAIDAEEREECAEARRAPYKNFSELESAAGEPEAADAAADASLSADEVADAQAAQQIHASEVVHRTLAPYEAWMQGASEELAAAAQDDEGEAEFQLRQGGGIPRALVRELGHDGCAALLRHLKANGGVGLAHHSREEGTYAVMRHGSLVSLSWEEALRHDIPFMFGEEATRSRGMEEAIKEGLDATKELQEAAKELQEESQRRISVLLESMKAMEEENRFLQSILRRRHVWDEGGAGGSADASESV